MKKKISIILLLIITCTLTAGCKKGSKKNEDINLYYNSESVKTFNFAKEIIEQFEKEFKIKVNINPVNSEKDIEKNISEEKENSVLLLDDYTYIKFANKNYLRDLGYLYKSKDTREKFSYITNIYGIYNDKYYGIGLMPYSLELVYNEEALKKLGIEVNENDMKQVFKKLNEKNIKIPTYIKSEYSKGELLSALVANDTVIYNMYKMNKVSEVDDKIYALDNGQEIFNRLNDLYKDNVLKEDMFLEEGEEAIKNFNEGKSPVVFITTLNSSDIKSNEEVKVVNKMPISDNYINSPVGVDFIVCSSIGNKKGDEVDKFLRYLLKEEPFNKLSEKNCISGNKKADSNLKEVQGQMANSIHAASEINILYIDMISPEKGKKIDKEVKNVLSGKYDGKEWKRIIEK